MIGLAWLVLWAFISPGHTKPAALDKGEGVSFRDRRVWAFIIINGLGVLPAIFVLYESANYLHQALGKSQGFIGAVLWIPALGWESGNLFFGWFVDYLSKRGMERSAAVRRAMGTATALALALVATPWTRSIPLVLAGLAAGMFLTAGMAIPSLAYASFKFPSRNAGFVAGLASAALGAASTIFMPIFGKLFDMHRYEVAFVIAAAGPMVGYAVWLWLTTEKSAEGVIATSAYSGQA
jgi:MFS family permease